MKWAPFASSELNFELVRRRSSEALIEGLDVLGDFLTSHGRSLTWNYSYPSDLAYKSAVRRLRQRGLVAYRSERGGPPVLRLTAEGNDRIPDEFRPKRWWSQRWTGRWHVLCYDVPEKRRPYREALRGFLKRMRMGCLQNSVWVSPRDIRADFDDLERGGNVGAYAFLFDAKTVLDVGGADIVASAWPLARLHAIQEHVRTAFDRNRDIVQSGRASGDELLDLSKEASAAYLAAMRDDPLLPRALWPPDYLGESTFKAFRALQHAIGRRLG